MLVGVGRLELRRLRGQLFLLLLDLLVERRLLLGMQRLRLGPPFSPLRLMRCLLFGELLLQRVDALLGRGLRPAARSCQARAQRRLLV